MPQLRITLRDLVGFPAGSSELQGPALEKWVREQFAFLPQLMCLMYAGFKRIAPDQDVGMNLEKEFLTVLEMHTEGRRNR